MSGVGDDVGEGIGDGVGDGVGDDVGDNVGDDVGDDVGDSNVGDDVGNNVGDGVGLRRIAPLGFRSNHTHSSPIREMIIIMLAIYRRLWLISACAYSGKRNDSMRLIKDMRLYGT